MDMTVVLPTYNGATRISAVLDRLRAQNIPAHVKWEVIVVDNNSQDNTAEIFQLNQKKWLKTTPLRYIFEPKQGLAFARQCGVDNALGAIVGFIDDDNWPSPDWVNKAIEFGQLYPEAGAYGGKTTAFFESPPTISISKISKFLALQDYGSKPYKFQPERQILPAGAGLVVRRKAWLDCIPKKLVRISQGGDDYEISLRLSKQGWEIYYNPSMLIQHYIPASRLDPSYLTQLTHRYGLCTCELMMISVPHWQKPLLLTRFLVGTLKRIGIHLYRHGWRQHDVGLQCQLSFYIGNFKSPFIYLQKSVSEIFVGL